MYFAPPNLKTWLRACSANVRKERIIRKTAKSTLERFCMFGSS